MHYCMQLHVELVLDNSFTIPAYLRTDAAVYYKRGRFKAALNVNNLFDIRYFEAAAGDLRASYGTPFSIQGTVSWEF
jgi:iron complex outermembrane recepter protein